MTATKDLQAALRSVYGDDAPGLEEQTARYEQGLHAFAERYGPGEVIIYHAPGRVNLIGEHTDYNHGYVLPVSLDKDVLLYARAREDSVVRLANREAAFGERSFTIRADLPPATVGDWVNYVQGPAEMLARTYGGSLRGIDALVDGESPFGVPRGAGLSSSSALTTVSMVALVDLNGIPLQGASLAAACSQAEWYVGTRGGIMDHFASVLGWRDHALFLDCRPHTNGAGYDFRHVPIPTGYAVVVVESGVHHRNTGPHFNRRVAEGRIGVRLLQQKYPEATHLRDVDGVPWHELEPLLPEVISADALREKGIDPDTILDNGLSPQTDTFLVRQRCRHVISENRRVLESVTALTRGDMDSFGSLLKAAHASARDDYDISTPEIEALVEIADAQPGVVGARLTGAGWGGCIVAVVAAGAVESFAEAVPPAYRLRTSLEARVFVCRSAAGAGAVFRSCVG